MLFRSPPPTSRPPPTPRKHPRGPNDGFYRCSGPISNFFRIYITYSSGFQLHSCGIDLHSGGFQSHSGGFQWILAESGHSCRNGRGSDKYWLELYLYSSLNLNLVRHLLTHLWFGRQHHYRHCQIQVQKYRLTHPCFRHQHRCRHCHIQKYRHHLLLQTHCPLIS